MLGTGLKNAPYGHHQWVWRQLHQSRMDSLLPSRIASPTFDHFLWRHVWRGTVDNRSLLPSLACIVRYSCPSKCMSSLVLSTCLLLLRFSCRLPGRWILFILIGAWNATAVDSRRCSPKSACWFYPSPCAPMILRATLFWHNLSGVDTDNFVAILVKRVTCLLKCYDQYLGVCEKPLLNAWTLVMMLENGILPRKHACLKLRDDPGNFRHSPLGEDTHITQIEGPTMHLQLFILLLVVLVESNHWERVLRFGIVKNPSANCI